MRTCYIHGKTSIKHTHMIQSEKFLSKYFIRPDFTKNVGFVRSCARVCNNRVSLRRKYGRISRWYLCLPDKMSSKPVINQDHIEEPDMLKIHKLFPPEITLRGPFRFFNVYITHSTTIYSCKCYL